MRLIFTIPGGFMRLVFLVVAAISALFGCNPAPDSGGEPGAELPSVEVSESAFDWDSVNRSEPVTALHKWESPESEVPRLIASDASGTRVAFVDLSSKDEGAFAVWVVQAPGTQAAEVLGLKYKPVKLQISDNGAVIFAVAEDAGYLYSLSDGKVLIRVDYDKCKEAAGLSIGGKYLTTWGGGDADIFHYSGMYNTLTENKFWETPQIAPPEETYYSVPLQIFPTLGITQFIVQSGTLKEPQLSLISLNTSSHEYRLAASVQAYFTHGVRSKNGNFYRALAAPKANFEGQTESGVIPLTHLATINLDTLSVDIEPLTKIFNYKPLAINRAGSEALVEGEDGGLDVISIKTLDTLRSVPKTELGDYELVFPAGDLLGALIRTGDELKWINLRHFEADSD